MLMAFLLLYACCGLFLYILLVNSLVVLLDGDMCIRGGKPLLHRFRRIMLSFRRVMLTLMDIVGVLSFKIEFVMFSTSVNGSFGADLCGGRRLVFVFY